MRFILYGMGYGTGILYALRRDGYDAGYIYDKENIKPIDKKYTDKVIKSWGGEVYNTDDITDDDVLIVDDIVNDDKKWKDVKAKMTGNEYADKLENEREFFMSEANKIGIKTGEFFEFDNFDDGIEFVKNEGGEWVIKLNGEMTEKWTTYVSKSADDMIDFIQFLKKFYGKNNVSFILQEKINGIEVALTKWNDAYFINFEYKNFMKMSRYKTGEMGTLVKRIPADTPIVKESKINELYKLIREHGDYNAPLDINMIINEDGAFALEPTSRWGYPIGSILMAGYNGDIGVMFIEAINGDSFADDFTDKWMVGIVLATPPFPYSIKNETDNLKLGGIPINDSKITDKHNVIWEGIYKDGDVWRTAFGGYNAVVTGIGNTIEAANHQANAEIEDINLPLSFWRTDIGLPDRENIIKLKKLGYLEDDI
ncbi:MAG: hypothetical protein QXU98_06945 [Candidatus Parvarchaeota archaeon]